MTPRKPTIIDFTDEADVRQLYPQGVTLLQHQKVSAGLGLAHYRHPPTDLPASTCRQHLILINTDVPSDTEVEQVTDGHYQSGEMKNEDVIIIPAQTAHSARWNQEHSYLAIALEPEAFNQQLGEVIRGQAIELLPQFMQRDPLVYGIGTALKAELEFAGFGGKLYVESLVTTLSAHLLRNYCTQRPTQILIGSLPKYRLNQVLDYIHAHLDQDVRLTALAEIAQVSPNYFAAQFKQSTGLAPHQYVIHHRIERAKDLLVKRKMASLRS
ncbi:AraC family transcriptional regulator, partial [Nostoc sp. CHAB 5715]|uniref:helix-turn-helix domain-containing protein n=1 Tax=Nostoc sp. CHAB 5715 TaxID=2780400 RepID=UPI001E46859C